MVVHSKLLCTFVVWTRKGIFTVEVPYNPSFMSNVCAKLERFWTSQVVPFMMAEVSRTATMLPGTTALHVKRKHLKATIILVVIIILINCC